MIAPATRRGVISDRRFGDGPLNVGVGGGWIVLVWVEFVTVGSAGSPGSLAIAASMFSVLFRLHVLLFLVVGSMEVVLVCVILSSCLHPWL
jgi:hypothetical protein